MAGVVWENGRHILSDRSGVVVDTVFISEIISPARNWEFDSKRLNRKTLFDDGENEVVMWDEDSQVMNADMKNKTDAEIIKNGKDYRTYWHITSVDPVLYTLQVVWDSSYIPPDNWWE